MTEEKLKPIERMNEFQMGFLRSLHLMGYAKKETHLYSKRFEMSLKRYFGAYINDQRFHRWWQDHTGTRVAHALTTFLPWLERFIMLDDKVVLEVSCGTGSSTVALAVKAKKVIAVDTHGPSLEVAKLRLVEDGLDDKVEIYQVNSMLEELESLHPSVDLAVLYGVLEHMLPIERQPCIDRIWKMIKAGGALFIYECPNRLWPIDIHTTGLLGWSWLPPALALRYGKFRRRLSKELSLKQMYREGYGLTFREVDALFATKHYQYLPANSKESGPRRLLALMLMNMLHIPRSAIARNLNLAIKKVSP